MNNQLFFLILFAFFIQALSLQYLKNRKENSNILKTSDDKRAHLKALKSSKEVIDHKAISDQINSNPASTWKHKVYPQFVGKTKAELNSQFMGHTPPTDEERAKEVIHDAATSNQRKIQIGSGLFVDTTNSKVNNQQKIPASFSWSNWATVCPSILTIRNQGNCGDCWAVSAAEVMTDRLCLNYGPNNIAISALNVASCASGNPCDGGRAFLAFQAWVQGTTSDSCQPYNEVKLFNSPQCNRASCSTGKSYPAYYGTNNGYGAYAIPGNVASIQLEIFNYGPITASFIHYDDFNGYKEGVYQHYVSKIAGAHAIKIIGWGTLNGVDYWECVNSWGSGWGMNGKFFIKRGSDESNIESGHLYAGFPYY